MDSTNQKKNYRKQISHFQKHSILNGDTDPLRTPLSKFCETKLTQLEKNYNVHIQEQNHRLTMQSEIVLHFMALLGFVCWLLVWLVFKISFEIFLLNYLS